MTPSSSCVSPVRPLPRRTATPCSPSRASRTADSRFCGTSTPSGCRVRHGRASRGTGRPAKCAPAPSRGISWDRTASIRPRIASTSAVRALTPPPRDCGLGSSSRSTRMTSVPARASSAASIMPVGPAPTTRTAVSMRTQYTECRNIPGVVSSGGVAGPEEGTHAGCHLGCGHRTVPRSAATTRSRSPRSRRRRRCPGGPCSRTSRRRTTWYCIGSPTTRTRRHGSSARANRTSRRWMRCTLTCARRWSAATRSPGCATTPRVVRFYRLVLDTPALSAALVRYQARGEHALATALDGAEEPSLTARLAAGQILVVLRTLGHANQMRIAAGRSCGRPGRGGTGRGGPRLRAARDGLGAVPGRVRSTSARNRA